MVSREVGRGCRDQDTGYGGFRVSGPLPHSLQNTMQPRFRLRGFRRAKVLYLVGLWNPLKNISEKGPYETN